MASHMVLPYHTSGPTPEDDDNDWDSADGGVSTSKGRQQRMKPTRTATRQAEAWLSMPTCDVPRIVSPPSGARPASKPTPTTVESIDSLSQTDSIPKSYANTIIAAFGPNADLYETVLEIPRDCSSRETRIAYFRRGRQVLAEHQTDSRRGSASVGGSVSHAAKLKFQAVSMAYEILTHRPWKQAYEMFGLEPEDVSVNVIHVTKSEHVTPVLKRSPSLDARRRKSSNAVRWNEEVEELVFSQDPAELKPEEDGERGRKKKTKGRRKKRAVIETEELKTHLENLDREAERHFVSDFLDDLECSIDDLLSLGSKKSGARIAMEPGDPNDKEEDEERDEPETEESLPPKATFSVDDDMHADVPLVHRAVNLGGDGSVQEDDVKTRLAPKKKKKSNSVIMEDLPVKQLDYSYPEIVVEKVFTRKFNDDGNSTVVTSDSFSTLSHSVVDKKLAMDTSRGGSRPSGLPTFPEDEDRLNTADDTIVDDRYSPSSNITPSTKGSLDRSSVLPSISSSYKRDTQSVATVDDDYDAEACEVVESVENWCGGDDDVKAESPKTTSRTKPQSSFCNDFMSPMSSIATREEISLDDDKGDTYQDFHIHLMAYLNSLTVDLSEWGSALIPEFLMETIMVSEDDLDGMLGILRTEMAKIPNDFDLEELADHM
jgi:hypothetical protein